MPNGELTGGSEHGCRGRAHLRPHREGRVEVLAAAPTDLLLLTGGLPVARKVSLRVLTVAAQTEIVGRHGRRSSTKLLHLLSLLLLLVALLDAQQRTAELRLLAGL